MVTVSVGDPAGTSDEGLIEQAEVATAFLKGLCEVLGVEGFSIGHRLEGEILDIDVSGTQAGFLVGRHGTSLAALEELTKAVIYGRQGRLVGRVNVDVMGYKAKRAVALEQFVKAQIDRVIAGGEEVAIEPMPSEDRKIVHQTVAEMPGVSSRSAGVEPRRYVVIVPDPAPELPDDPDPDPS